MRTNAPWCARLAWVIVLLAESGSLRVTAAAAQSSAAPSNAQPCVAGVSAGGPVAAVAATDSPPWKWKKKKAGKGDFSSIAVDAQGQPHVAFRDTGGTEHAIKHAWLDGQHWVTELVDAEADSVGDVALAIDGEGGLHMAYGAYLLGPNDWFVRYAHKTGDAWEIETIEVGGSSNSITADEDGAVHLLHVSNTFTTLGTVRHLKRTRTGWDAETVAMNGGDFGSSLVVRNGKAHATWSSNSIPRILEFATLDAGLWTVEEVDEGIFGSMVLSADDVPHAAYTAESSVELRHAWFDGQDWQHETLVSPLDLFGETVPDGLFLVGEMPALVADPLGRIHMVFQITVSQGEASGHALLAATLAGDVWSPTAVGPNKVGFRSSIAVAPSGIVHVSSGKTVGDDVKTVMALRLKGCKLSLSVVPKAAGTVTVSPTWAECSGKLKTEFYPGTEVTLTEVPAPGFMFVGWSKDGSGTDATSIVTLDKKRKVVAKFAPVPP